MRTIFRSKLSKLFAEDPPAAEIAFRPYTRTSFELLRLQQGLKGSLARLFRYGEEFAILLLDLDGFKVENDPLKETAALHKPTVIINDAGRAAASPRPLDLHDICGHHRYYGKSAF